MKEARKIVDVLKKGISGRFVKTLFFFLKKDSYSSCIATITGNRCNLVNSEGLYRLKIESTLQTRNMWAKTISKYIENGIDEIKGIEA